MQGSAVCRRSVWTPNVLPRVAIDQFCGDASVSRSHYSSASDNGPLSLLAMSNTTPFGYPIPPARRISPLRQRMIEDMMVRNFAHNTQESYLRQVSLFARHSINPRSNLALKKSAPTRST